MPDARKVHLAVDALGAKHSGTAMVARELLSALVEHPGVGKITVYSSPPSVRMVEFPSSPILHDSPQPRYEGSLALRVAWNVRLLGDAALRDGADMVVSMAGTMQRHSGVPHVSVVQQSLPFCAEALRLLPRAQRLRMRAIGVLNRGSCRSARRVYVQTPTMRSWVSRAFSIDPSRFDVHLPTPRRLEVPEAVPPSLSVMERAPRGTRMLYVGNSESYKNVSVLLRGLPVLRARGVPVTLFATWPPEHPACLRGEVVSLGYLRGAELAKAYVLADVLVQPSLVETASLPLTEAMALGTPTMAADRLYARDIGEDASLFFDPLDPTHFVEQVVRLFGSPELRARLVAKGRALIVRRSRESSYHRLADSIVNEAVASLR